MGVVLNDWNPKFADYYGYEPYGKSYYSDAPADTGSATVSS